MQTNGDDTEADRIIVAAGTISTQASSYELDSGDNDDLEILGAGPDQTTITNSGSGNEFMMNLNGARKVTMRDLTLRGPGRVSGQPGRGAASGGGNDRQRRHQKPQRTWGWDQLGDRRQHLHRWPALRLWRRLDRHRLRHQRRRGGELRVERTLIEDASWGIDVDSINVVTRVRRVRILDPLAYGLRVTTGGFAVMENSLITVDDGWAINAATGNTETTLLTVRHTTIVDTGGDSDPVIYTGEGGAPAAGSLNAVISDTIVAGNENPLECHSPMSSTTLTMRYSWFFHSANVIGKCTVNTFQTLDSFAADPGRPCSSTRPTTGCPPVRGGSTGAIR